MIIKLLVTIETDKNPQFADLDVAKAFASQFHTGGDLYATIEDTELVACAQDAMVVEIDGFGIKEEDQ